MLSSINNIFRPRTLLNKIWMRQDPHAVEMSAGERILSYINRVHELGTVLQSIDVSIHDKEIAMAVLWNLPPAYKSMETALEDLDRYSINFTLVFVERRILQKELRQYKATRQQRRSCPVHYSLEKTPKSGESRMCCDYSRRKDQFEDHYLDKNLSMRPTQIGSKFRNSKEQAFIMKTNSHASFKPAVETICLLVNRQKNLSASTYRFSAFSCIGIFDFEASAHLTSVKSMCRSLEKVNQYAVHTIDKSIVSVEGRRTPEVSIDNNQQN